jgi:succinate dehydrogenase hydrophobic anchor subunit
MNLATVVITFVLWFFFAVFFYNFDAESEQSKRALYAEWMKVTFWMALLASLLCIYSYTARNPIPSVNTPNIAPSAEATNLNDFSRK